LDTISGFKIKNLFGLRGQKPDNLLGAKTFADSTCPCSPCNAIFGRLNIGVFPIPNLCKVHARLPRDQRWRFVSEENTEQKTCFPVAAWIFQGIKILHKKPEGTLRLGKMQKYICTNMMPL
jgi:hypothetical protein